MSRVWAADNRVPNRNGMRVIQYDMQNKTFSLFDLSVCKMVRNNYVNYIIGMNFEYHNPWPLAVVYTQCCCFASLALDHFMFETRQRMCKWHVSNRWHMHMIIGQGKKCWLVLNMFILKKCFNHVCISVCRLKFANKSYMPEVTCTSHITVLTDSASEWKKQSWSDTRCD